MIIRYAITTLRYIIFCNVGYVMRKTSTELISAIIKYMIFRYKMKVGNIKYIKIHKIGQQ